MLEMCGDFIFYVGCYALACYLYENLRSPVHRLWYKISLHFGIGQQQRSLSERFGKWAAITGSTDGIGKAYARELARRGLNIVLISRSPLRLQNVANEIATEFSVQTRTIVADFTQGKSVYEHIERELDALPPVGIWVNNVGQFTSLPGNMANFDADELTNLIETNVKPVTLLSRMLIRRMSAAHVKGVIVNMSSMTEAFPTPLGVVYGASKAYTRSLTLALQHEARPFGVRLQNVAPGFVLTKLIAHSDKMRRKNFLVPHTERFARSAVDTLCMGIDDTSGYVWHSVTMAIIRLVPTRITTWIWLWSVKLLSDELKA